MNKQNKMKRIHTSQITKLAYGQNIQNMSWQEGKKKFMHKQANKVIADTAYFWPIFS